PPECFKDFRSVDAKMSVELADTLKLTDHPAIKQISEGDIRDPLEVLFDLEANEIHRAGASKQTGVIFLELERYGVEHPEADVVMGIRRSDNGEWDLRYVNYNEDKIRPLSQQRASCCNDIKEIVDPRTTNPNTNDLTMPRHLDHVLFFYDYSQNDANRRTMMTPHKAGYSSMHGIIPGGGGYEIKNGFTAVYDSTDARDRDVYTRATAHNYNITTGYKVDMKYNNGNVNTQVLNGGISRAEKDVDRYNQQRRGFVQPRNTRGARDNGRDRGEPQEDQRSHRQGEFNDKSGCNPFPVTSWLNDKLGKIPLVGFLSKGVLEPLAMQFEVAPRKWKHGPNFTKEDLCPSETEQSDEKIHQNRSDCGCESGPYDRGYAVNHPDQTHDNTSALGSSY
ncbi:MAG: hypothetical protein KAJ29_00800, partial [Alphaproteobacteria bacterium]|nr:hypothetical protein [Alphaproteobacteria bacterium]